MTGSSPSWSAQAPRPVSLGCSRFQELATAVPYRVVSVVVVTAGRGQVLSSASLNSSPCRDGRPRPLPRGGAGKPSTRSERSRPHTSTGRSASRNASRAMSYPASKTTRMSGSPGCQCPASARRPATPRTWAAGAPGPHRHPQGVSHGPPGARPRAGRPKQPTPGGGKAARHPRGKGAEPPARPSPAIARLWLAPCPGPRHTERHGHRLCLQVLSKEPEDHLAVAVSSHHDTPGKIGDLGKAGQPRLNGKLSWLGSEELPDSRGHP